ncbi:MAG: hypothetical protein J2P50_13835 [Hyphomicrobiaceae bacterium]|nr:hypothetical protein [Hyphomicrobiaceae bacterium]
MTTPRHLAGLCGLPQTLSALAVVAVASIAPVVAAEMEAAARQPQPKSEAVTPRTAPELAPELSRRLTPEQRRLYLAWRESRSAFERQYRAYWSKVEAKRDVRKARRLLGQDFTAEDYVATHPPKYQGPELPADIARIVTTAKPPPPEKPLPTIADFVANAKKQFGFVPKRATEQEFKQSYAREALRVGLTKDQVVRVYALETGGQGTYDMQSGINPVTKQGKPISSALGYAQLLHANSTGELVKHGEAIARRLTAMAAAPGTLAARTAELKAKAAILSKMLRAARSVPDEWSAHQRFAMTPAGLGIHALNLDADVGPWIQVLKLKGLKDSAATYGHPNLSGAEIELMNLAGPTTGLEMMTPLGRKMPTANFFSEGGYTRNGVVQNKTAAELLAALESRMEAQLQKPGSIEFAQIFDQVARQ